MGRGRGRHFPSYCALLHGFTFLQPKIYYSLLIYRILLICKIFLKTEFRSWGVVYWEHFAEAGELGGQFSPRLRGAALRVLLSGGSKEFPRPSGLVLGVSETKLLL